MKNKLAFTRKQDKVLNNNNPQRDSGWVSRLLIWQEIYKNDEGTKKAGTVEASNDDGSQQYTESRREAATRTHLP